MSRERGIMVYPMPDKVNGQGFDRYALLLRADGAARMVHTEGVAYRVDADTPWRWTDYAPCEEFSIVQLINFAFDVPPVDLADWIRTFGARLEGNFHQIAYWYNETEEKV